MTGLRGRPAGWGFGSSCRVTLLERWGWPGPGPLGLCLLVGLVQESLEAGGHEVRPLGRAVIPLQVLHCGERPQSRRREERPWRGASGDRVGGQAGTTEKPRTVRKHDMLGLGRAPHTPGQRSPACTPCSTGTPPSLSSPPLLSASLPPHSSVTGCLSAGAT